MESGNGTHMNKEDPPVQVRSIVKTQNNRYVKIKVNIKYSLLRKYLVNHEGL